MCSPAVVGGAEDPVTGFELSDAGADCFDVPCQLAAEYLHLRPEEAEKDTEEERLCTPMPAVRSVDRRGMDPDEDLVGLGDGLVDLGEMLDVRRAVPLVDGSSHRFILSRGSM